MEKLETEYIIYSLKHLVLNVNQDYYVKKIAFKSGFKTPEAAMQHISKHGIKKMRYCIEKVYKIKNESNE